MSDIPLKIRREQGWYYLSNIIIQERCTILTNNVMIFF